MAKPRASRKLPNNWKNMSIEEQVEYVEDTLHAVAKINDDFPVRVTLQCSGKNWWKAFAQKKYADEESSSAFVCRLVRRDDFTMEDLPMIVRKKVEWMVEAYGEKAALKNARDFDFEGGGHTITEALEELFKLISLLFDGYEFLYFEDDYLLFYYEYIKDEDGDDEDEDDEEEEDKE